MDKIIKFLKNILSYHNGLTGRWTTIDEIKAYQREIQNVAERFNAEVSTQLDEWITAYKDVGMNSTVKRKIRKLLGEESTSPDDSNETKIRTQSRTEKEKTEILGNAFSNN